jgi:Phage tail lysozyme
MADAEVIKSFLVNLGFRQDESSLKKFEGGIESATKKVVGFGLALEATVAAVVVGVAKFAANLESLYFAASRLGTTKRELKGWDRAAQDVGASAGDLQSALEALAASFRTTPWTTSFFESMGVQIHRNKEGIVDTKSALLDLLKTPGFSAMLRDPMQYPIAQSMLQNFGIPESLLNQLRDPAFLANGPKHVEQLGEGFNKASDDAHTFMNSLRDVQTRVEGLGAKVQDALEVKLQGALTKLNAWIAAHGDEMADKFVTAVNRMMDVGLKLADVLLRIVGYLAQLDTATSGWSTMLLVLAGSGVLGNILKLASGFKELAGGVSLLGATLITSGVLDFFKLITGKGPGGIGTWIHDALPSGAENGIGLWIARTMASFGIKSAQEALATNNPIQYIIDNSPFSIEQAMGLLANLRAESDLNPNAQQKGGPGYGLAQWGPEGQADFAKYAGHDIHGSSFAEQLQFALYQLAQGKERAAGDELREQTDPSQAAYLLSLHYERPKAGVAEAERRAGLAADMQNTFNITINGVKDADEAGRKAEQGVARATRNFVGNVQ